MGDQQFTYLEDEDFPLVFLGVEYHSYELREERFYRFKDDLPYEVRMICHQTGGMLCNSRYLHGFCLPPKSEHFRAIHTITGGWLREGLMRANLDNIIEYRKQLDELLGVDCCVSFRNLEEALYPVDCNKESVRTLTGIEKNELDEFIVWPSTLDRICGIIGRWKLFILGENSD